MLHEGVFSTGGSVSDIRLDGHPYQGVVVSYHGVSIADDEGHNLGILCHFDMIHQSCLDDEYGMLQDVARRILPRLLPGPGPPPGVVAPRPTSESRAPCSFADLVSSRATRKLPLQRIGHSTLNSTNAGRAAPGLARLCRAVPRTAWCGNPDTCA
jgi:hypothetical protein